MFDYEPVPVELRRLMLAKFEHDLASHNLYLNPMIKADMAGAYFPLLLAVLEGGSPETFSAALDAPGLFQAEQTYLRQGKSVTAKLPANYATTLAAGEFNRYYMRVVCRLALEQNAPAVEIYRAKAVSTPRQAADERLGRRIEPQTLLADLRQTNFERPSEFELGAPNSGLSVQMIK